MNDEDVLSAPVVDEQHHIKDMTLRAVIATLLTTTQPKLYLSLFENSRSRILAPAGSVWQPTSQNEVKRERRRRDGWRLLQSQL
jgi:hypothetical protein